MSMNQLYDLSKVYMEQIASVDESAIGDRARNAVADQRLDAAQKDTQQSVDKLAKREKVTGASASLAAKRVEADVRKSSSYGPQRPKPGTTGGYRIEENEIDEAVRGADNELRRAASQERQTEKTTEKDYRTKGRSGNTKTGPKLSTTPHPKSVVKNYADQEANSIAWHDKKSKGKFIPGMATNEALDPVGQEDADIDNDGKKNTKSDKYLTNRRKVRGVAIRKESFSNWRQDLSEVMDTVDAPDDEYQKQIKEKKIQNKIKINPDFKEAVEEIGGQLIEMIEVEEGYQEIDREKETKMYRRAGNLARTSLSSKGKEKEDARNKSAKIVSAITRQKENERFNRIGQSPAHNEEFVDEGMHKDAETGEVVSKAVPGKTYYPAQPMKKTSVAIEKEKKQKNEEFELDEAEGSYGQTPKASAAYGALANKRRNTPASEYPQRGAKKVAVKSAERHMSRSENPDAGNRGKQSTKPYWTSDSRKGMTQKDRNWRRGADEYGHSGYDGEGGGGSLPKGKKLERQKKTGVSAESFDYVNIELDEKTLTSAETAKKEQIVKSMKKNFAGFKSSYGKDAKSVMYATATKQAKKVAEGTAEDALAMVRASVAKKHGAASIIGSPENKAAQAAQKKPTEQPKRKLSSYSIPGAPKEKSYND
jgi:hypothetical protein